MSVDVSLITIRKSDFVPFVSFWLGGNGTKSALTYNVRTYIKPTKSLWGGLYYPVSATQARDMLADCYDDFYPGHSASDALDFLRDFKSQIDEFALFVEVV